MGGAGEGAYARRPVQRFVVLLLVAGVLAVVGLGLSAPRSTGPDPLTSAASPTPGAVQETPASAVVETKLTPPTAPAAVVSAAPPPAPSADVSPRPEPAARSSQQLPLPTANPPAVSAPPAPMPAFDAAMNAVLAEGYPGGSLAVVRDGKLVYTRGYGFAKAGVAATPMTRYRQASVSKAVTGSLLAQLVTNGTLTMDLRVFPYLGVAPVDPRTNAITVRMLKDHTSGFAGDYFLFESRKAATFYGVASPPDPDTMVRWTAHYQLATDPGSTYHYNNTNYAILSRVIEKATGRAWIDLVRDMAKPFGIATWRRSTRRSTAASWTRTAPRRHGLRWTSSRATDRTASSHGGVARSRLLPTPSHESRRRHEHEHGDQDTADRIQEEKRQWHDDHHRAVDENGHEGHRCLHRSQHPKPPTGPLFVIHVRRSFA